MRADTMPIIGRPNGWGTSVELRHLRTFRVVARTLNLTKAAAELHYAQSSVTEQIQALEAQLDTQLFDRSGRRIRLTPSGERATGADLRPRRRPRRAVRRSAARRDGRLSHLRRATGRPHVGERNPGA